MIQSRSSSTGRSRKIDKKILLAPVGLEGTGRRQRMRSEHNVNREGKIMYDTMCDEHGQTDATGDIIGTTRKERRKDF